MNSLMGAGPVLTLMSRRFRLLPILQILEKILCPSLLEKPHQWTPNSFHLRTRYLRDPTIPIDVRPGDRFELQVTGDVCVY